MACIIKAGLLLLTCVTLSSATGIINLKVGLYNSIPDLQNDGFATYKSMVENGFNTVVHTVNAVVNEDEYLWRPRAVLGN